MDTIYALASARGRAGVSVLRISGPLAFETVRGLGVETLPEPRRAALRRLSDETGPLDDALVLLFQKGASFTGEDVAELHVHGSLATISAVLRALSKMPGCRLAEAGEFTRRALENGCLDLAQVEGLADLIDAETESQRRQALRVLSGAIGRRADGWRRDLIRAAALIEATIDFADEDVPVDVRPEVNALLDTVLLDLRQEVAGSRAAERIRDGFEVAIVGAPNSGKSTLLNALAGRDAALTSDVAGTTRDIIEVRMDMGGLAVTVLDTAGLRTTDDPVETLGIERAVQRAKQADLRVFLDDGNPLSLGPIENDIVVGAKADLTGVGVSGLTGQGLDQLVQDITKYLQTLSGQSSTITRERHRLAISNAIAHLESAQDELISKAKDEVAAEALRHGIFELDLLVGRVDVEDLLGEIFSSFCIGK
ncbi:tRNA uridine-5-carboxymethylaminomethyl(34) synthesis GTPase MnmE [Falsirhodobacter sp. 20TX0035]|uniref:tRNA uridine-5-carboxymethylaminomethyl(34) synthesis GTPase MnmE n=1 Tax=Falsirhodobacter sp. 20TX0035 TaxID=3022019 RepID=UPI00232B2C8D|nr:tRNA uridine-5-carboxymethylaminomethyl(34) synthesis GTPase MnmE [Falsirhodobacter sp. 20TX0035]MDB6452759.1 tRNA uridine-5-carboxymethylaminomethyl(34) synthesis GTPase MnmE [Falsirhodobacter sp. 20TX0035]